MHRTHSESRHQFYVDFLVRDIATDEQAWTERQPFFKGSASPAVWKEFTFPGKRRPTRVRFSSCSNSSSEQCAYDSWCFWMVTFGGEVVAAHPGGHSGGQCPARADWDWDSVRV